MDNVQDSKTIICCIVVFVYIDVNGYYSDARKIDGSNKKKKKK